MRQAPSAQQIQDILDRLNRFHQWFRKHQIAIAEDPDDHLWKLDDAGTEGRDDEEELKEVMSHFNAMNNAYLGYIHPSDTKSQQAASRTFYEHREWLEQRGMKVRLCAMGFWVEDEEGG